MNISNHVSPSFGRIYIKEESLSSEQYAASLEFADKMARDSKAYKYAEEKGMDLYITSGRQDKVLSIRYLDSEADKFYSDKPKGLIATAININYLEHGMRVVDKAICRIIDAPNRFHSYEVPEKYVDSVSTNVEKTSKRLIQPKDQKPSECLYLAEPSEINPENVWIV